MRDQIIGIYLIPVITQVLVPMLLLIWQAFSISGLRNRIGWFMKTICVGAYLAAISIAGLWLIVPWYLSLVFVAIFVAIVLASLGRIQEMSASHPSSGQWMGLAIHSLLALVALGLVFLAVSGRQPPKNEFADLMFPLQDGTYYVVAGGSIQLLNPHVATLRSERFREYRGQSYGIDIVKVNFLGMRASVVASRNPRKYAIFGDAIYAPCSGIVLDAEDKFRDMPPPEPDRKHMTGNYVLLNCGEYEVFLGHLQEGAVRVRPGDFIETGAVLGQVGNSGNTGEPHLHIHAQRPSGNAGMLAGDPLPVRFNGRFLSRNSWMRQHAGPFAPPVGGIVIFLAASVIGLVYWFPIRRRFRTWGATDEETRQRMVADDEVLNSNYRTTLAVTIAAQPEDIWPWLVQIGYQRGGLYSYDWLDRLFGYLDRSSAERILPEFQQLAPGDVIPIGVGGGFPVKALEPFRMLLLAGHADDVDWAWQFSLLPLDAQHTRLVSRNCVRLARSRKRGVLILGIEPAAFIMTRKMLLGIKRRAEALSKRKQRVEAA